MGIGASKRKRTSKDHQGNLLVEGFIRYTQSTQGWTRIKSKLNKQIKIEVHLADKPLGTWRGSIMFENMKLEDLQAYVHFVLGADKYELLASTEDDEYVFRDLFDFNNPPDLQIGPANLPRRSHALTNVGDHRGENSELFEGKLQKLNKPRDSESSNEAHQKFMETTTIREDSSSGEEEVVGRMSTFETFAPNGGGSTLSTQSWFGMRLTPRNHRQNSKLGSTTNKHRQTSKVAKASAPPNRPAPRELVFKRQDFMLNSKKNERTAVSIAQSTKGYASSHSAIRATMQMMGTMVEEFPSGRHSTKCKLTFVCSMDPLLSEWEVDLVTSRALSQFGGKIRVEQFLNDAWEFFRSPANRLMLTFRQLAGAGPGEMDWKDVERSKNELQLGTNVTHAKFGHGVVQSFDMKGRVRVVYDSKEVVDHLPEEKDELRVAVMIGTRVKHPERGAGTVKAFDEAGRVHVKFDNGDFHRYKQEAWKKKMNQLKMMGIGGALGTVKLSWRPFENVREGMGRVKFAVGVSTESVLEYILEQNSGSTQDELKSGSILERRVVERINENTRIIYENRKMPPPLTPRDFVFKEIWGEVAPKTFVVVYESFKHSQCPVKEKTVRGETHLSGWLLEPLYLDQEAYDGEDHVCRVTYQLCIDTGGFVAPDSVDAVRQALLLGALTDTRAFFWAQSQIKSKLMVNSHQVFLETLLSKKGKKKPLVNKPSLTDIKEKVRGSISDMSSSKKLAPDFKKKSTVNTVTEDEDKVVTVFNETG